MKYKLTVLLEFGSLMFTFNTIQEADIELMHVQECFGDKVISYFFEELP
jgi:hypothetical protein